MRAAYVITELIVNHTSDQHPWFQRARRAKAGSRWRNFYVWAIPRRNTRTRASFSISNPQLELGRRRQSLLLAPLLRPSTRPQLR
jgi:glycosidase